MNLLRVPALALILTCAIAAGADQDPVSVAGAFRFLGGERVRLILFPDPGGVALEQIVSEDGYIALPTGGESLNIKGKTILEAQKAASDRIEKDSPGKRVFTALALLSVPVRSIYVGGEGLKTSVSIPLGNGTPLTLYAAILTAGGATTEADLTHVTVTHTRPDGTIETQGYDASKFGETSNKSLGPVLEPGDVVKVPKSGVVLLAGEVNKAGPLNIRELVQTAHCVRASCAIYVSGGLKPTANRKQIKILRTSLSGRKIVLSVDLDAAEQSAKGGASAAEVKGDVATGDKSVDPDPEMRDGDVLLVGQGGGISVLGKVRLPSVYPINGQTVKLTRILAQAGGFAEFAKTSDVIIIKANGTMQHANMGNPQKNGLQDVDLEDGDLVFVGERLL